MKIYTLQIGDGDGQTISAISYSETLTADDLFEAIDQAKTIARSRDESDHENTLRLLDDSDGDSIVEWVRPVNAVR